MSLGNVAKLIGLAFLIFVVIPWIFKPNNSTVETVAAESNVVRVYDGNVMVTNDQGRQIVLQNNPVAHDPTWSELIQFFRDDYTEFRQYKDGSFTCGDFAELIHNNAEAKQIKSAFVLISISDMGSITHHAINAFNVSDRGLVYTDSTSSARGGFADRIVNIVIGGEYEPEELLEYDRYVTEYKVDGIVTDIELIQW